MSEQWERVPALLTAWDCPWREYLYLPEHPSTNAYALERALPTGTIVHAEVQSAGRGRHGRGWVSSWPSLTFSIVTRPQRERTAWGWIPLLTGIALTDVLPQTGLKWPNDVLRATPVPPHPKLAGILCEAADDQVVIGCGINMAPAAAAAAQNLAKTEVEAAAAARAGYCADVLIPLPDTATLLAQFVQAINHRFEQWEQQLPLLPTYRQRSLTLGRQVTAYTEPPVLGQAIDIAPDGALVVDTGAGLRHITAGEVEHLR